MTVSGGWVVGDREHQRQSAAVNGFAAALKLMGKSEAEVLELLAEARDRARAHERHDGARRLFSVLRDIEVREMLSCAGGAPGGQCADDNPHPLLTYACSGNTPPPPQCTGGHISDSGSALANDGESGRFDPISVPHPIPSATPRSAP